MKLKELLQQLQQVQQRIKSAPAFICGGTPRDRYLKNIKNISDLDITTGDKSVQYLAEEFFNILKKQFNVNKKTMDDGHTSIYLGKFKIDFSSNFIVTNIDQLLKQQNINNPNNLQKEMFSRDFTCNALLMTLDLKNILDPTNKGIQDLNNKIISTCLSPEITLTSNKNRVIRAIYLASKLKFNIDDKIINYVKNNPETIKISSEKSLREKLIQAFEYDGKRAADNLTKMKLWDQVPILPIMQKYYL